MKLLVKNFVFIAFAGTIPEILLKNTCERILQSIFQRFKVGLSPSKKNLLCLLQCKPLKNDENAFYFILKVIFVLKIFKFLSCLLGHVEKQLDYKDNFNFKIYDIPTWLTYSYNTHIAQYLSK